VGTESAHAFFWQHRIAQPRCLQQRALRSIIHAASIDCAGVFARNANAAPRGVAIGMQLI